MNRFVMILASLFAGGSVVFAQQPDDKARFAKWEKEITAIEKRLKEQPPAKGGVVFAGSSTIRLWDLKKSFPDRNAINLGFGGSQIPDSTHFASRILLPLEPRAVIFYAGDNDIASGRTAEQVDKDFRAFVKHVHEKLPKTQVYFLAIKASVKRWEMFDKQQAANKLVKEFCATDSRLTFIDTIPLTLGADGKPDPENFVKDGLHLSPKGYEKWNAAVRKALK